MNKQQKAAKKSELVVYKGDRCFDCGGVFPHLVYDFDHRDPIQKTFEISAGYNKPRLELMAEVDKCDLVCANCHRIRTAHNPVIGQRIRDAKKGRPLSNSTAFTFRGRHHTAEAIAKFSVTNSRPLPPDQANKARLNLVHAREVFKKKGFSLEQRLKMRVSALARHARERGQS